MQAAFNDLSSVCDAMLHRQSKIDREPETSVINDDAQAILSSKTDGKKAKITFDYGKLLKLIEEKFFIQMKENTAAEVVVIVDSMLKAFRTLVKDVIFAPGSEEGMLRPIYIGDQDAQIKFYNGHVMNTNGLTEADFEVPFGSKMSYNSAEYVVGGELPWCDFDIDTAPGIW